MPNRPLQILRAGFPDEPALDIAISRALLLAASAGETPETFRLNRPGRMVAFGKRDTLAAGYPTAVAAARTRGYEAVERLAGGRAALFHEGTLAFSWSIPDPAPREGTTARFLMLSGLIVRALTRLGIGSKIGELPGEYCPGSYSVHAGPIKIMGVGQRLARTAAHIGGVIVVSGSRQLRDILIPVYDALGLAWDPATAGSLEDVAPHITMTDVEDALLAELAADRDLDATSLSPHTLERAKTFAADHLAP